MSAQNRSGPDAQVVSSSTGQPARTASPQVKIAVLAGVLALAARAPSDWAVLVTAGVGALGAVVEVGPECRKLGRLPAFLVVLAGSALFLIAKLWMAPSLPRPGAMALGATLIAAVAEELFFRRLIYGWLASRGPAVAVGVSAALFAVVHVPAYGWMVVPLDFAAGVIFGWQRWATGRWETSAATHAIANLLAAR